MNNNEEDNIKSKIRKDIKGWTLKNIEIETRIAVQKAAKKEGMTLGKYCNIKLREAANETLKSVTLLTPAIQVEDIQQEVKTQISALKEELQMIIKSAIEESKPKHKNLLSRFLKI